MNREKEKGRIGRFWLHGTRGARVKGKDGWYVHEVKDARPFFPFFLSFLLFLPLCSSFLSRSSPTRLFPTLCPPTKLFPHFLSILYSSSSFCCNSYLPMNPLLKASTALKPGAAQSSVTSQTLSEQEQKLLKMYGNLPTRKALLGQKLKERKYFDSGDYALSKAGKTTTPVGSQHPQPENIPHSNIAAATASGSGSGFPGGVHHGSPPPRESLLMYEQQ